MAYPSLDNLGLKIPFDIDGSAIIANQVGISTFLTNTQIKDIVDIDSTTDFYFSSAGILTIIFPQPYNLQALNMVIYNSNANVASFTYTYDSTLNGSNKFMVEASADTTNGVDGVWEEPLFPNGQPSNTSLATDAWRLFADKMTFTTGPMKGFRVRSTSASGQFSLCHIRNLHLYADKSNGYNPDDIRFLNSDLSTKHSVIDFGNVANPTTYDTDFYIENISPTKTAHTVVLTAETDRDVPDSQILLSSSASFVGATSSLAVGDLAATATYHVYLRLVPAASTAPQSLRVKYVVASWS